MSTPTLPALKPGEVPILRTCAPNGESFGGFKWPLEVGAKVEAADWDPEPRCGNGLHGLLRGEGAPWHLKPEDESFRWMILGAQEDQIVDLGGRVKFPSCRVLLVGEKAEAVAAMQLLAPGASVVYGTATAGDYGTATAGDYGTATAGNGGTATAGNGGTATAGNGGTATAGYYGTATAGNGGTATAGYYGTATAGYYGTATAGYYGTLLVKRYDCQAERYRVAVGYVGEDGIEAGVPYVVRDGKLAKKEVSK